MRFEKAELGVKSNKELPTEVKEVVKGTARRIVVVKSPDKRIFEEAIFIVREEYLSSAGVSRGELLKEAQNAAKNYTGKLRLSSPRKSNTVTALASAAFGSGLAVAVMKIFGL